MYVSPTVLDMVQDSGVVATGIASVAAIAIFVLDRNQSEVAIISGAAAILFLCFRLVKFRIDQLHLR